MLRRAEKTGLLVYVTKPAEDHELQSVIEMTIYKRKTVNLLKESESGFSTLTDSFPVGVFQADTNGRYGYSDECFRSVVETATDAIIFADAERKIVFCNRKAEVMFGYSVEEITGKPLTSIMPERYRYVHRDVMKKVLAAEKTYVSKKALELAGLRKDGSEFPLELCLSSWKKRNQIYLTAFLRDITERIVLEKAVLETEERERQLIGSDLHDGLGQLLAGISLKMQYLVSSLKDADSHEAENAERIKYLMEQAKEQVKMIIRGLMPVDKKKGGIIAALEELAVHTTQLFNIPCTVTCTEHTDARNDRTFSHLFRIAQEAVTNAAKHGKPKKIEIGFTKNGDKIALIVRDDGKGITGKSISDGIGMQIMHYRAGLIGASLDVAYDEDEGTRVACILPDMEREMNSENT